MNVQSKQGLNGYWLEFGLCLEQHYKNAFKNRWIHAMLDSHILIFFKLFYASQFLLGKIQ